MIRRRREIPRAPHFAAAVLIDAGDGGLLEGGGPAPPHPTQQAAWGPRPQIGIAGQTENEVHILRPAEIEHLGRAVVAVAAQEDFHPRPMATDLADQAPQMGRGAMLEFGG